MKQLKGKLTFAQETFEGVDVFLEETIRGPDELGVSEWWGRMHLNTRARTLIAVSDPPHLTLSDGRGGQILVASLRSDSGEVVFQGAGALEQVKR